jgi:adenine-specific DNA methylase
MKSYKFILISYNAKREIRETFIFDRKMKKKGKSKNTI